MIDSTGKTSASKDLAAIEALARENDVSFEAVESLYRIEVVKLEQVARIKTYVPVLAGRRVRSLLREDSARDASQS